MHDTLFKDQSAYRTGERRWQVMEKKEKLDMMAQAEETGRHIFHIA